LKTNTKAESLLICRLSTLAAAQFAKSPTFALWKSPVQLVTRLNVVGALTLIFLPTSWHLCQTTQKAEPAFALSAQVQSSEAESQFFPKSAR
jgi:hypothetical protein